jgi:hypothetical protein
VIEEVVKEDLRATTHHQFVVHVHLVLYNVCSINSVPDYMIEELSDNKYLS